MAAIELNTPLPSDPAAEKALLGCLLLNSEAFDTARMILKDGPDEFSSEDNGALWRALTQLRRDDLPFDVVPLNKQLMVQGNDRLASNEWLASFLGAVPSDKRVELYASQVHEHYLRRQIVGLACRTVDKACDIGNEITAVAADADAEILQLLERGANDDLVDVGDSIDEWYALINDRLAAPIPSGFPRLDALIEGFARAELTVIAGRASMGKTAMALSIADQLAIEQGKRVCIFSLEMSARALVERMLTMRSQVPGKAFRKGDLSDAQQASALNAREVLRKSNLFIDDMAGGTVDEWRARARVMCRRHRLDLLIVDYLQLLSAGREHSKESKVDQLGYIARVLKNTAKVLDIPVIAMAQLNREAEGKVPAMSHLAGSGQLEDTADVVITLYREAYYDSPDIPSQTLTVRVAKNRNGARGDVTMTFDARSMRVVDQIPVAIEEGVKEEMAAQKEKDEQIQARNAQYGLYEEAPF